MLHVISAWMVARDLHTIAPGPLERTIHVGDSSRRNEEIVENLKLRLSVRLLLLTSKTAEWPQIVKANSELEY